MQEVNRRSYGVRIPNGGLTGEEPEETGREE